MYLCTLFLIYIINVSGIDNGDGKKLFIRNVIPLLNIAVADHPRVFNALIKSDNKGSKVICNTDTSTC
jgi:hypothetical protein